ncbi:hypothetical protein BDB01DRAFT_838896 [Pilobolus umbonatus]|nr:hypothetical protein BDB01DRAFT_838896 [Pilobolus umbonatus]
MTENKTKNTTLKKLARWSPASPPPPPPQVLNLPPLSTEAPFTPVNIDRLVQGGIYILKIKQVTIALFEGSEVDPMRWSEARQLPGDFDIFEAFDESGNPPIHLWARCLRVPVPNNWFSMFEEAKRKQRQWAIYQQGGLVEYEHIPVNAPTYSNTDVSTMALAEEGEEEEEEVKEAEEEEVKEEEEEEVIQESTITHDVRRQFMASPISSQIFPVERGPSILDREQIRRHLAPGQGTVSRSTTNASLYSSMSSPKVK